MSGNIYLFLLSCIFPSMLNAQISQVNFGVAGDGSIITSYYLNIPEGLHKFNIELFVSTDGGNTYSLAKNCRGDIDIVGGTGWKKIIWNPLADEDAFESNAVKIKVKATEQISMDEKLNNGALKIGSIFTPSYEMSEFQNGVMTSVGYARTNFKSNPIHGINKDYSDALLLNLGLIYLPFFTRFDVTIDPKFGTISSPYSWYNADESYSYTKIAIMGGFVLFPSLKNVVPYIGAGVLNTSSSKDWGGITENTHTTDGLGLMGLQVNFNSLYWGRSSYHFILNLEYKKPISSDLQLNEFNATLGVRL